MEQATKIDLLLRYADLKRRVKQEGDRAIPVIEVSALTDRELEAVKREIEKELSINQNDPD
jgi:translation initiation factor 2 gamma subunit (eIF-2gamma)